MRTTPRIAALVLVVAPGAALLGIGAFGGVACSGSNQIAFNLKVPADVRDRTTWYEVGAFAGSKCPPLSELGGGVPTGSVSRASFHKDSKTPPALGDLERGSYAFIAAAKSDDCSVVAAGCAVVDVGSAGSISIAMRAFEEPAGKCRNGSSCQVAQCVPSGDNADPSVGANCSLQLVGAGPLPNPLSGSGTVTSTPAIVSTPNGGALVVYREYDGQIGAARLTFQAIDNGGGALPARYETLPDRCPAGESGGESDGVGMAFRGDKGLVVVARAPCNNVTGFDFYAVDQTGKVEKSGVETSSQLRGSRLSLASQKALAPTAGPADYLLVFSKDDETFVANTKDVHFGSAAAPFGGSPPRTHAWIAGTDRLVALLASATGTIRPPVIDAGAVDAGDPGDASRPETSVPTVRDAGSNDGGGPGSILRLSLAASGANLSSLDAPIEFPGAWGSMAAQGRRLIVASGLGTNTGNKPVTFRVFDLEQFALGKREPTVQDGFTPEALGKVEYADVAFRQARLFFAVQQPGSISLVSYDKADGVPVFAQEVQFSLNPRIPSLKDLRDGRIAIAAGDTRVTVAWLTGKSLTTNDPVGGYAMFACR